MSNRAREGSAPGRIARVIAVVVLCLQAVPVVVPIVAGLAHELYHVSERLSLDYLLESHVHPAEGPRGQELGHSHAQSHGSRDQSHGSPGHTHESRGHTQGIPSGTHESPSRIDESPSRTHHAHAHGASPQSGSHAHAPAVDALLTAAGSAEGSEIAPPPSPDRAVDLHLPASPAFIDLRDPAPGLRWAHRRALVPSFDPVPDPPPPRV